MMIKTILICLLSVFLIANASAATNILTGTVHVAGAVNSDVEETLYLNNADNLVGNISVHGTYSYTAYKRYWGETTSQSIYILPNDIEVMLYKDWRESSPQDPQGISESGEDSYTGTLAANMQVKSRVSVRGSYQAPASTGTIEVYVIFTTDPIYHISGSTDCLSEVKLYHNQSGTWTYMINDSLDDNHYKFNITTGIDFKLVFNNGHYYIFNVTGDEVYNYNGCICTHYRLEESCGNLIPDSEGYYCEWRGAQITCYPFYAPTGILTITESTATQIEILTDTFAGAYSWILPDVVNDTTYTLTNPYISWGLKVIVQNRTDDTLINDATVRTNQSCYCASGDSIRQKKTIAGQVTYGDMSLQDASIWVYATGYKTLDENSTGYSAFLSGRSNFSSKTWIVKLEPNSGNGTSEWHETARATDIHFRGVSGNVTSKILNTDAYVRLYYQNNNSQEESMTLKFQSSSTHSYFSDELSWEIPHNEAGYKEITTAYFTPCDYSYRAVMYNSSIYGWNLTIPLTVRDATSETEQHYENLTTLVWFMHASDGRIDYREDIDIGIHACSNNTTLMTVDVEVYKDSVLLCYKNLTATDFINADFPYYYVYEPQYSYVSGANYSVRMYGFDRTLLETDYVECITDATTRQNKLTIHVKDRGGTPLTQAYVFLEGWGSLPTGSLSYNAYEGIADGTYQYKASKSGYISEGWAIINISGSDETVTYTLTSDTSTGVLTSEKMTNEDLKEIFYPCMFFLFIIILVGGLMHVAK